MGGFTISPVSDGVVVAELDRGPENLWTLGDLRELTALLADPPEGAHVLRVRSVGEAFCLGRERGGTSTAPGVVRAEAETLVAVTRAFRRTRLVTVAGAGYRSVREDAHPLRAGRAARAQDARRRPDRPASVRRRPSRRPPARAARPPSPSGRSRR